MGRSVVWGVAVVAGLFGGAAVFGFARPPEPVPAMAGVAPQPVVVASVGSGSVEKLTRFPGVVRSRRQAELSFTVAGRLMARPVSLGDAFREGDVLAELDPEPFENRVHDAEAREQELAARLEMARLELGRVERLFAKGAASADDVDRARTAVAAGEAGHARAVVQLAEARRERRHARLEAPFSGVVTAVRVEPQEYARPGVPVLAVSSRADLELRVELPETLRDGLAPGRAVRVELPLSGRTVAAEIRRAGTAAAAGHLFPVTVALPAAAGLRPGMSAQLLVPSPPRAALALPVDALVDPSGSHPFVWTVREGRARAVDVSVEGLGAERVLVRGALQPGEPVVVGGHARLVAGDAVAVMP